jgi:hypothetical protein
MTPSTAPTFSTWVAIDDWVSCSWVWRSLSAVETDNHADTDVADDGRVDPINLEGGRIDTGKVRWLDRCRR